MTQLYLLKTIFAKSKEEINKFSKISNERFLEGNYSLWTDLKKNDFPDLVFDISDDIQRDFHLKLFRYVAEITDLTFLMKNCITDYLVN